MNIRKFLSALLSAGMLAMPPAAHSAGQTAKTPKQGKMDYSFLDGKTGTVSYSIWSEKKLTDMMNAQIGSHIKNFVYVNSMTGGLSMLKSGRADFMLTSDITAAYIIQRDPTLRSVVFSEDNGLAMILRHPDVKLRDSFNSAIRQLKASGKTDELYKTWVKELPVGQEPAATPIAKTSYPETVYVGVSGDIPPLDYVAADGKPAGYNIALLAEISKLIGKNIEVVSVDPQAKLAALLSKKIDVFFWQRLPNKKDRKTVENDADRQAFHKKFIFTEPYCVVKTVLLLKK